MSEPVAAPKATLLSDVVERVVEQNGEGGLVFDVAECPVCGGEHSGITLNKYKGKSCWSHWYDCPTIGDPVSVAISVDKGSYGQAHKDMVGAMQRASAAGVGMLGFVIWKQGRTLYLHRVRDAFPIEDLEAGMKQLQSMPRPEGDTTTWADLILMDLEKELGPPPKQPLPSVPRGTVPKRITLFEGKKSEDD